MVLSYPFDKLRTGPFPIKAEGSGLAGDGFGQDSPPLPALRSEASRRGGRGLALPMDIGIHRGKGRGIEKML